MRKFHAILMLIASALALAPAQARDDAGVNSVYSRLAEGTATNDLTTFQSLYSPDAVYLGPNRAPIIGNSNIASAFYGFGTKRVVGVKAVSVKFRVFQRIWHGRNAATDIGYGKFTIVYDDQSKDPRISYSKFVTLSQRQPDGSWRFRLDIDNAQSPDTGPAEYAALKPVEGLIFED